MGIDLILSININTGNTTTNNNPYNKIGIPILGYLDGATLVNGVSLVSKSWNVLSKHNTLWFPLLQRQFPDSFKECTEASQIPLNELNFYELYKTTSLFWNRVMKNPDCKTIAVEDFDHHDVHDNLVFFNQRAFGGSVEGFIEVFNFGTCSHESSLPAAHETINQLIIHGDKVICGSYDKSISVWNATSKQLLHKLEGHSGGKITGLKVYKTIFNTFRLFSTAKNDPQVKIWDLEQGLCVQDYHIENADIRCFDLANDTFAAGNEDGQIFVFREVTGLIKLKHHAEEITHIKIHEDFVISGSMDKTIKVCQRITGELLSSFTDHRDMIFGLKLFNGKILSYSTDFVVRVHDLNASNKCSTLVGHNRAVTSVEVYDNKIITTSIDHTIKIWDFHTEQLLKTIQLEKSVEVGNRPTFAGVRNWKLLASVIDRVHIYS